MCALTFKVGELLIFVFCVIVFIDLFTDWGKFPLSCYVRFVETQLPVVSRTSSFDPVT